MGVFCKVVVCLGSVSILFVYQGFLKCGLLFICIIIIWVLFQMFDLVLLEVGFGFACVESFLGGVWDFVVCGIKG